ncbi:probable 3-hydroxyisobutyrate dehydrogenase, mitochondrial isoform X3 [Benincasa hispida]|uniref:probable 3-hydroxyisobutyrate dehydrogenase, mitochondrial isoform X3 n=1 Tax=Benincasa hispida TaxID=102211 RepID=UPI0018FF424D|nr:probable 3-hydroxyisobutyrate dehydrogenase, mitochondrial isoform X3 [Benincasa hispida]
MLSLRSRNCNIMKKYSDMGVATKETPFEVAEASDVVITMLPSPSHEYTYLDLMAGLTPALETSVLVQQVREVYNGSHGLLHGGYHLRPWLLIDSSTIDPQTSRELSASVSSRILKEKRDSWENPVMLDAPVSGGILAADAGTLTFMVGGPEEAYYAAKSLFLSMGKGSVYCGGAGNGSAAKICNNLALAVSMLGVSEALALGQSLGISAKTLTKVFNSSSARCWSSESYNPVPGVMEEVPSARDYDGGFASKLMAKDLNLAAASAGEVGLQHPLTSQAQEIYKKLCEDGYENKDFSCVFRHFYSGDDEL